MPGVVLRVSSTIAPDPSSRSAQRRVCVATPEVRFESADGHDHFHLLRVMRYSLWSLSGTAEVAPGLGGLLARGGRDGRRGGS